MTDLNVRAFYSETHRITRIAGSAEAFSALRGDPDGLRRRGVRFPGTADMARYERAYNAGCLAACERTDPLAAAFPWHNVDGAYPFAVLTIRRGLDRSALKGFRGRLQLLDDARRDPARLP